MSTLSQTWIFACLSYWSEKITRACPKNNKQTNKRTPPVFCFTFSSLVTLTFNLDIWSRSPPLVKRNCANLAENDRDTKCKGPDPISNTVVLSYDRYALKASIHFLTQSCDPISRYGKPVERTNEIFSRPISLVRSTDLPQQLTGSHDWVRRWVRALASPSDSVLCLIGIWHVSFSSDARHCPAVKTKFVCFHSNWSDQTPSNDSTWWWIEALKDLYVWYRVVPDGQVVVRTPGHCGQQRRDRRGTRWPVGNMRGHQLGMDDFCVITSSSSPPPPSSSFSLSSLSSSS